MSELYKMDTSDNDYINALAFKPAGQTALSTASPMNPITQMLQKYGVIDQFDQGGTKTPGWGNLALNTGAGLMNAYLGMKQYGLAKKQFDFSKDAWNKNYQAGLTEYNNRIDGRAAEMAAANPNFVDTYKRLA
jgi:hypothetical protein